MELERIHEIEVAMGVNRKEILRLGVSILFLVGIILGKILEQSVQKVLGGFLLRNRQPDIWKYIQNFLEPPNISHYFCLNDDPWTDRI